MFLSRNLYNNVISLAGKHVDPSTHYAMCFIKENHLNSSWYFFKNRKKVLCHDLCVVRKLCFEPFFDYLASKFFVLQNHKKWLFSVSVAYAAFVVVLLRCHMKSLPFAIFAISAKSLVRMILHFFPSRIFARTKDSSTDMKVNVKWIFIFWNVCFKSTVTCFFCSRHLNSASGRLYRFPLAWVFEMRARACDCLQAGALARCRSLSFFLEKKPPVGR